jgi:hypothetical protein
MSVIIPLPSLNIVYRSYCHIRCTDLYDDTQNGLLESTIFIRGASYKNDIYVNDNNYKS